MNERITEIAKAAGAEIYQIDAGYGTITKTVVYDEDINKFAELIIKDCVNIVENCDGDVDYARYLMQKHFGIEE